MGGKKRKKGQFVFLFGDARMRIREDVQTMPGLEGRGGAAAGGGGREMGDGERISFLVVILFFLSVRARIDDVGIFLRMMMMMMRQTIYKKEEGLLILGIMT